MMNAETLSELDVNEVMQELADAHARTLAENAQLRVLVRNHARRIAEMEGRCTSSGTVQPEGDCGGARPS